MQVCMLGLIGVGFLWNTPVWGVKELALKQFYKEIRIKMKEPVLIDVGLAHTFYRRFFI